MTMLGWLGPKCPLDTGEKMWTEHRMRWLAGKLGINRLMASEVILPEPRFFPDPYGGTLADARRIFDRVCGYMGLDPERFELEVLPDESIRGAAGIYEPGERPRITLASAQLPDPERLVATLAHELAHDILLGGGLLTGNEGDHEPVTDLVPVFLGLGLFTANAPVRDRSYTENRWHYFQIARQGYLPSRMIGYALALFAYARGETEPAWAGYLRPDAAEPLKGGLRYLLKTGDTLFHPDTARQPVVPPTEAEAIERLTTGSPTVRAMTLRDVGGLDRPSASLIGAIVLRLRDRDPDVQFEAARVLPRFGEAAHSAVSDLLRCLRSRSAALRACAAVALPAVGGPADEVVPELTQLLEDTDPAVADAAAAGLGRLGPTAATAVPALLQAIRAREIDCQPSDTPADAVVAIGPSSAVLRHLLDPVDPDVRQQVMRSLRTARSRREGERRRPQKREAEGGIARPGLVDGAEEG
jgi:HEAT repeats